LAGADRARAEETRAEARDYRDADTEDRIALREMGETSTLLGIYESWARDVRYRWSSRSADSVRQQTLFSRKRLK
jgi:hypothetical protein